MSLKNWYFLSVNTGLEPLAWLSRTLFGVFILALLPGCVSYPYQKTVTSQTSTVTAVHDYAQFESDNPIALWSEKATEYEDHFLSKIILKPQITLPNEGQNIVLSYYRPKGLKVENPALILLPITNGNVVTENLAHYFVSKGFIVLRFPSRSELSALKNVYHALTRFSQIIRDDVMNIKRGLQWLKEQPEVDAGRIGIMGISLGAILSSLMIELEADIRAAVLFLGGGNLAGIFQTSKEKPIAQFRERRFAQGISQGSLDGKDLEEYLQEMKSVLDPIDPLRYPSLLAAERILMVNGYFDAVIDRRYARALWNHLQRPSLIYIPTGHYGSILFYHYARFRALRHFERYLVEG